MLLTLHHKTMSGSSLESVPEESSLHFTVEQPSTSTKSTKKRIHRSRCSRLRTMRRHCQAQEWTDKNAADYMAAERRRRGLHQLQRSTELDDLAKRQAEYMVEHGAAVHSASSIEELQQWLGALFVGENVQSGSSLKTMMTSQASPLMENVFGDFDEYGMALVRDDEKGVVYFCQLFRGV